MGQTPTEKIRIEVVPDRVPIDPSTQQILDKLNLIPTGKDPMRITEVRHLLPGIRESIVKKGLSAPELEEYVAGMNTIYQNIYDIDYNIAGRLKEFTDVCAGVEDIRNALTLAQEFQNQFPNGHFKKTFATLLPKILEKASVIEDRQAIFSAISHVLKEREAQIALDEEEYKHVRYELQTQINNTDPDELIEVEDYGNPGQKISIPRREDLAYQRDNLQPPEYEYALATQLLLNAPSINYFLEAMDTMFRLQQITGIFPNEMPSAYINRTFGIFSYSYEGFQRINGNILKYATTPESLVHILEHPQRRLFKDRSDGVGVGNFVMAAIHEEITPLNLHRLLDDLAHVPGSSVERHNSNREDAISVERAGLSNLKELIHDQREGIHQLIQAIISYAQDQNDAARSAILEFTDRYPELKGDPLLDADMYKTPTRTGESVLEVLQRLRVNTAPASKQEVPPVTGIASLDKALKFAENGSEISIAKALREMNILLLQQQVNHQQGIEPNIVVAVAWLDHKTFELMRDYAKAEKNSENLANLYGMYRRPFYTEAIKLLLLTSSITPLTPESLQTTVNNITHQNNPNAAAKVLFDGIDSNMRSLAQLAQAEGSTDSEISALWSGNIHDGLHTLAENYPPSLDAWNAVLRLRSGQEGISSQEERESEIARSTNALKTPLGEMDQMEQRISGLDVSEYSNIMIDTMYQTYSRLKKMSLGEAINRIPNEYKNFYQLASVLRTLGIESKNIRYNNEDTPLLFLSGTINGQKVEAVLWNGVIPIGSATVNGEPIQDYQQFIRELHLPKVYSSVVREGD